MRLAMHHSELVAAVRHFTDNVMPGPSSARAQRVIGYKDRLDSLVASAIRPLPEPPTEEEAAAWWQQQQAEEPASPDGQPT